MLTCSTIIYNVEGTRTDEFRLINNSDLYRNTKKIVLHSAEASRHKRVLVKSSNCSLGRDVRISGISLNSSLSSFVLAAAPPWAGHAEKAVTRVQKNKEN